MKKRMLITAGLFCTLPAWAAAPLTDQSPPQDQLSYSYGYFMGRGNAETLNNLNLQRFYQGLNDGSAQKPSLLSETQMTLLLAQFKKTLEAKPLLEMQMQAQKNAVLGDHFLAQNAKQTQIKTTDSGLQYLVLIAGKGQQPSANATVKVNYEGRLLDHTVFDSSIAREQAVDLNLSQTIVGLVEGIQTMQEGGKSRFFIPAKLAYGEMGSADRIPPNSTVIFDVELLKVLPEKP